MATSTQQQSDQSAQSAGSAQSELGSSRKTPPRGGSWVTRLIIGVVVLSIVGGAAWGAVHLMSNRAEKTVSDVLTTKVQRGELVVTVTEDGSLESAVNIDIKCEVAGGTSILWIVDDGNRSEEGREDRRSWIPPRWKSRLTSSGLPRRRRVPPRSRPRKTTPRRNWRVEEYVQGTFVKSVQDQDAQITIAEENLRSAQNALEHSERMFRKGYISALDLESQKFQVQRAQLELDSAQTAKDVLVKFTKLKMVQELESKRDSAEAKMRSEGASFDLEESRLKRLETQLEKCVITAPADGMAVYANEQGMRFGGSQQSQIEEGAAVRERQTMLRLPDLAQMQVKVTVHESKVEMLSRAWKAAHGCGTRLCELGSASRTSRSRAH